MTQDEYQALKDAFLAGAAARFAAADPGCAGPLYDWRFEWTSAHRRHTVLDAMNTWFEKGRPSPERACDGDRHLISRGQTRCSCGKLEAYGVDGGIEVKELRNG